MEMNDFVTAFAELFDDTDPSEITPATNYTELNEWSSLTALSIIAMADEKYGKTITGREVRNCATVEKLFELIASK